MCFVLVVSPMYPSRTIARQGDFKHMIKSTRPPRPEYWQSLFGLWSIQGIVALVWLAVIPTDTDNPLAFGFSPARLILIAIAIALIAVSLLLWLQSRKSTFRQTWLNPDEHLAFWDLAYLAALLTVTAAIVFTSAVPLFKGSSLYSVYAARLRPLVLWFGLSSLEFAILAAWIKRGTAQSVLVVFQPVWKKVVLLLMFFLLVGILVTVTKIGITPDDNWGVPPIPFMEWQIFLVLIFIGVCVFFSNIFSKYNPQWIPFGIYVFTIILWLSQPINPAFTATPPRAPNFEIYPFSDPQFYAQYAQSALTGNGFLWPEVPARPFYVAFLTWAHLLGNQKYQNIIVLQTFVLAIFPVLLYLLGREIGGKPLGLGLSLLAAFRDINANIAVPFASNVTYSKLFLSELPTALLISLATLLSIRWLRSVTRSARLPLLIGGLLGAAALIRLQSSILIFPLVCLAFFVNPDRRQWLKGSALIVIGFALVLTPWLVRNYLATGGLVLDNPISQTMTMARRWSGSTGNETLPRLPGETDAQYSSRLTRMAITNFKEHPGFILHAAANHFVNNEIASLLAFPVRDEVMSLSEIFKPQHVFWKTPLTSRQIPLFAFYVLLFSVGIATAWHSRGLSGLLPLIFGFIYNLWTALFLSSGERFIVPLDWSIHLYEFLGLIVFGGVLLSFTEGAQENILAWIQRSFSEQAGSAESPNLSRRYFALSFIIVLLLGAFLPLTESVFPQRYPPKPQKEILQELGTLPQEGEVALYGRALYPRYYDAGDGEPGTAKLGYGPEEKARLVFFLIGPQNGLVIFELKKAPEFFPNTADVYMVGTQSDGYFSPRVVKVEKDSETELYVNKSFDQ